MNMLDMAEQVTRVYMLTVAMHTPGSGKTYTMEGPPEDRGVNYRTLQQLFQTVEARREETTFTISVSLLEVCSYSALLSLCVTSEKPHWQCFFLH